MKVAVFPGSFDPITRGHIDIIKRSLEIFDKLIIAVLCNSNKNMLFTLEDRMNMIIESCNDVIPQFNKSIIVKYFDGLLIDFLNIEKTKFIVRGLRIVSDFEYEFQMTMMNRELNRECETIFLIPNQKYSFISSSLTKEIALLGGDISYFVTDSVVRYFNGVKNKSKRY